MGSFAKAYFGESSDARTLEAVVCFKTLFADLRNAGLK